MDQLGGANFRAETALEKADLAQSKANKLESEVKATKVMVAEVSVEADSSNNQGVDKCFQAILKALGKLHPTLETSELFDVVTTCINDDDLKEVPPPAKASTPSPLIIQPSPPFSESIVVEIPPPLTDPSEVVVGPSRDTPPDPHS